MPKNKRFKYKRVKKLSNVTIFETDTGEVRSPLSFPWNDSRFAGMKKILELGCGKGEHSLAFAAADPEKYCLGVDMKSNRICTGAEKALALGLWNVRFLRARIEKIETYFLENSIHEIWLPFPDPHPKNRTAKFRLSGASFLDAYSKILAPGGTVHLKTDSESLYSFTTESIVRWGGKIIKATGNLELDDTLLSGLPAVVSAYEKDARSKGMRINYVAFTLQ